jgi:transcriptional regulator with XRE-family HTH domain
MFRLSLKRAADLLGVSDATVSYWKNGHRGPDMDSLVKVSELFKIDMSRVKFTPYAELLRSEMSQPGWFEDVQKNLGPKVVRMPQKRGSSTSSRSAGNHTTPNPPRRKP